MWDEPLTPLVATMLGQTPIRYAALIGSNLAKGGLEGLGAIGNAQDYLQRAVNIPADALAGAMGIPVPQQMPGSRLNSSALLGYGRAGGLVDRPTLAPQNEPERYAASIAEGIGGAIPYALLTGNTGLAALIMRGMVPGGVSGAVGEYGAQLVPDYEILSRIGGNKAVSGAFGIGSRPENAATTNAFFAQYRDRLKQQIHDEKVIELARRAADLVMRRPQKAESKATPQ